jgi:hypothetical protein
MVVDMTKSKKEKAKELLREVLAEDKEEKAKKDTEESLMLVYSAEAKNPEPTTKGPYMVIYVKKSEPPFRKNVWGWMGEYSMLTQGGEVTTIEMHGDNLKNMKEDSRITILKKGLKNPPTTKEVQKLKQNHINPPPKKKSLMEKILPKKSSKKKGKAKPKGKKKK